MAGAVAMQMRSLVASNMRSQQAGKQFTATETVKGQFFGFFFSPKTRLNY